MNQKEKDALRSFATYLWMSIMLLVGMSYPDVTWLKTGAITIAISSIIITVFAALIFQARARREYYRQ